ncbi:hypothetical protein EV182_002757 [Spiromyces aspiralis]|uniref:Uncharacterized protein n=1 Tax=Spiromyces aspiralis TaxID=68401 RepID=A0ACC1HS18_9FUNG|nr:hypothetical protein EV182_002757 [Spiromyces aspiralis]
MLLLLAPSSSPRRSSPAAEATVELCTSVIPKTFIAPPKRPADQAAELLRCRKALLSPLDDSLLSQPLPDSSVTSRDSCCNAVNGNDGSPKYRLRAARESLCTALGSSYVMDAHRLVDSRARLGLLDQASVDIYASTLASDGSDTRSEASGDTLVSSLSSSSSYAGSCCCTPPSPRSTDGNAESDWPIFSSCDCFDELLDDPYHICWPLDPVEKARSVEAIRRATPCVRIPPRYRSTSLKPLAIEYRMMKANKIVCPLKNRLNTLNPRRMTFEIALRERGELVVFSPKKSPLSTEIIPSPPSALQSS